MPDTARERFTMLSWAQSKQKRQQRPAQFCLLRYAAMIRRHWSTHVNVNRNYSLWVNQKERTIVEVLEVAAIAVEMVGVTTAFSADTVCMEPPSSVYVTGFSPSTASMTCNKGLPNCGPATTAWFSIRYWLQWGVVKKTCLSWKRRIGQIGVLQWW